MSVDLKKILELKKLSIPGPWYFDNGNWEIESHNEDFYRHSVCSVSSSDTRACNDEGTQFTCGIDTPEFIVLMENNIEEIIQELSRKTKALEKILNYNSNETSAWQLRECKLIAIEALKVSDE